MLKIFYLLFEFDLIEDYSEGIAMGLSRNFGLLRKIETVIDYGNFEVELSAFCLMI